MKTHMPLLHAFCMLLAAFAFYAIQGCASSPPPGYRADLTPDTDGRNYVATDHRNPMSKTGPDRSAVRVGVREGRVDIGFDLLGMKGYKTAEWADNVWAPLKLFTYPADYIGYMATEHPWQTLFGAVLISEYTGTTDWVDLPGESKSRSSSSKPSPVTADSSTASGSSSGPPIVPVVSPPVVIPPVVSSPDNEHLGVNVTGDGNAVQVYYNVEDFDD